MPIYSYDRTIYIEANLINEEVLSEAIIFKFVKKDKVPDDFKKFAINICDTLEKESGKKLTFGVGGTSIAQSFGIRFGNAKKKIETKDPKNCYTIGISWRGVLKATDTKPKFIDSLTMNTKLIQDYLDSVFKKQGLKPISKKAGAYYGYWKQGKDCIYAVDHASNYGEIVIYIRCLEDTNANKEILAGGARFLEAGGDVSSEMINHTKDQFAPNTLGFEGLSPEELYGFTPDLGLTRSEELSKNSSYSDFFRDPKIMSAFTEHLDLSDSFTRKAVLAMNEAEQGSVLTSLTSKLYDNIISKIDDIDYGEIPSTKGDITKLSNYEKLNECVELLRKILIEFKQDTKPIDEIATAISNVSTNKDIFIKGYKFDCELPIVMYNNTVLTIISAVSYMIATCIEFIKTPNQDTFQITLDKMAYAKTKQNMLYNNLKKFNKCCKSGDMQKAMNHILQNKVKRFVEGAAVGVGAAIIGSLTVAGVIAIVMNIVPILREMVFFFYYTRMRVSDFFDIQADLLQMNAYNLENDMNKDAEKKERIVSKQLKIVELFRKIANKISFTGRKAEIEATKDIANTSKKMKLNDVTDELPDSVSALF